MSETTGTAAPAPSAGAESATTPAEGQTTESTENGANGRSSSADAAQGESAAEKEVRKFKFKVDNEEIELDERGVVEWAQKAKGADKRFQQAAEMRKKADNDLGRVEALARRLEQDPGGTIERILGPERLQQIIDDRIDQLVKLETMDPQERRAYEAEQRARALEAQIAERDGKLKSYTEKEQEAQQAHLSQRYERSFTEQFSAAAKQARLPQTPYVIGRMAQLAQGLLDSGQKVDPARIAAHIAKEQQEDFRSVAADPARLREILGDEAIKRLRQQDIDAVSSEIQQRGSGARVAQGQPKDPSSGQFQKKPLTPDEARELFESRRRGGR